MFKALKPLLILAASVLISGYCLSLKAAQVEHVCPGTDLLNAELSFEALIGLQEQLQNYEQPGNCDQSSDFLWLRGLLSLKLGNFSDAAGWLELSLMKHPNRPGVLLDYALAQEAAGEIQAALSIYAALLADFDPSDPVRALIRRRVEGLERALVTRSSANGSTSSRLDILSSNMPRGERSTSAVYGQLTVSTGFDSNLNSASSVRALSFSIENQLYSVPIPEADLPQNGRVENLTLRIARRQALDRGYWGISFRQSVRVPQTSRLSSAAGEFGIDVAHSFSGLGAMSGELLGFAGIQAIALDRSIVMRSSRSAIAYELSRHIQLDKIRCPLQLGYELEGRRYPNRQILDGNLGMYGAKLSCSNNSYRIDLFVRAGDDQPLDPTRAGGVQKRAELGLGATHQFGIQTLRFQLIGAGIRDEIGYNQLISNNKIRETFRRNFLVEWSYKINQMALEPFIGYEISQQSASIDLFSFRSWQAHAGLRWNF